MKHIAPPITQNPDHWDDFLADQTLPVTPIASRTATGLIWMMVGVAAFGLFGTSRTNAQSFLLCDNSIGAFYSLNVNNGASTGRRACSDDPINGAAFRLSAPDTSITGSTGGVLTLSALNGISFLGITSFNGNRITNIAAGTAGTDAVNLDQLKGVAAGLGGGGGVNSGGGITAPSYLVQGQSKNNVGSAISVLDSSITSLSNGGMGLLRQAAAGANLTVAGDLDGAKVDFTGKFSQTVNSVTSTVSKDRVLTGVAKGTADNDAVNVRQLKDAGLIGLDGGLINTVLYDSSSKTRISFGGGLDGTVLDNVAPGLITIDSRQAVNGSQLYTLHSNLQGKINGLQGRVDTLESKVRVNSNGDNRTRGIDNTAAAGLNVVSGDNSQGIGNGNRVDGDNSIGQGNSNLVASSEALGIGNGNDVSGHQGIAVGNTNTVSGQNGVGIGSQTRAAGRDSIAIGTRAQADGTGSVTLGAGARAPADDAVALGSNALADRNSTVSVGSAGHERQIANVAAGIRRTDAANWGQVQDAVGNLRDWANYRFNKLDRQIAGIGAMSAASTQMAINGGGVEPGRGRVIAGAGFSGGQGALALGYANAFNERVRFSIGGTVSNRSQTSAGVGIGVDL